MTCAGSVAVPSSWLLNGRFADQKLYFSGSKHEVEWQLPGTSSRAIISRHFVAMEVGRPVAVGKPSELVPAVISRHAPGYYQPPLRGCGSGSANRSKKAE